MIISKQKGKKKKKKKKRKKKKEKKNLQFQPRDQGASPFKGQIEVQGRKKKGGPSGRVKGGSKETSEEGREKNGGRVLLHILAGCARKKKEIKIKDAKIRVPKGRENSTWSYAQKKGKRKARRRTRAKGKFKKWQRREKSTGDRQGKGKNVQKKGPATKGKPRTGGRKILNCGGNITGFAKATKCLKSY